MSTGASTAMSTSWVCPSRTRWVALGIAPARRSALARMKGMNCRLAPPSITSAGTSTRAAVSICEDSAMRGKRLRERRRLAEGAMPQGAVDVYHRRSMADTLVCDGGAIAGCHRRLLGIDGGRRHVDTSLGLLSRVPTRQGCVNHRCDD